MAASVSREEKCFCLEDTFQWVKGAHNCVLFPAQDVFNVFFVLELGCVSFQIYLQTQNYKRLLQCPPDLGNCTQSAILQGAGMFQKCSPLL